jgi:hypothetical protein
MPEQAVEQNGVGGRKFDELEPVDAQGVVLNFGHDFLRSMQLVEG